MKSAHEMPIYVRIEEYKDVLEVIELIKKKVEGAKALLGEINEIKAEEDKELERWEESLSLVEKKIGFIDKTLFEPEGA